MIPEMSSNRGFWLEPTATPALSFSSPVSWSSSLRSTSSLSHEAKQSLSSIPVHLIPMHPKTKHPMNIFPSSSASSVIPSPISNSTSLSSFSFPYKQSSLTKISLFRLISNAVSESFRSSQNTTRHLATSIPSSFSCLHPSLLHSQPNRTSTK